MINLKAWLSTVSLSSGCHLAKWLLICLLVGTVVGSASAFFLWSLDWAGHFRDSHLWLIALLPVGGLLVGGMYYFWGKEVVKGNNLLIEELHSPQKIIPFKMAPLVLMGTVLTHFFGGSAGREGTAVQIGGAVADQCTRWFKLNESDRQVILLVGISAGFASVFGTPLAGAVFALELTVLLRCIRLKAIVPCFLSAFLADFFCRLYPISHTHYQLSEMAQQTSLSPANLLWAALAGIIFGLVAQLFSKSMHYWTALFKSKISFPPLRPVIGGAVLTLAFFVAYQLSGETRFVGLGVPFIEKAFQEPTFKGDFLLKLLFTTFTLGCGFKGGEVTPLFFIGASLGNAVCWLIPLDMSLLASMGFVGVFAGATNTPLACTLMGMELFGVEGGCFIAIACGVSYLFSGRTGIYSSQIVGFPKSRFWRRNTN